MYQTVIESCNGRTAVDILGRSYFVAGSAPVVPGKKIWTDGKSYMAILLQAVLHIFL